MGHVDCRRGAGEGGVTVSAPKSSPSCYPTHGKKNRNILAGTEAAVHMEGVVRWEQGGVSNLQ